MENFEPVIVAFCCLYCGYTAADTAGSQQLTYPTNINIIKLPCASKIDSLHVVKAFEKGADGVYIAGCLEGECHFANGNAKATARIEFLKKYLQEIGIEPERLDIVRMSAGMGEAFAQTATEITEKIRALGPSPLGKRTIV